jgi:hypothetical protein
LQPNNDWDTDEETQHKEIGENDSDNGVVNNDGNTTDQDDDSTVDDNQQTIGWKVNTPFYGVETRTKFEEVIHTRSVRGDGELRVGSIVMKSSANSPMMAWKLLMTNAILESIVDYSNEYGKLQVGTDFYNKITKGDLLDFISVLFISSIQKRKDKISNWWSDDPLKENPIVKKKLVVKAFARTMLLACFGSENATIKIRC